MPSYNVTSRVTHAATVATVEALHREDAVRQVVHAAEEGDEIEVSNVEELPGTAGGATGATGGVFGFGASPGAVAGPTGGHETRATRAQLNEMSKDELIAVADKEGAEINHNWNKSDIIDAIVKRKHP
jgi:hypothetical protein